jgi:hypothetical protein
MTMTGKNAMYIHAALSDGVLQERRIERSSFSKRVGFEYHGVQGGKHVWEGIP